MAHNKSMGNKSGEQEVSWKRLIYIRGDPQSQFKNMQANELKIGNEFIQLSTVGTDISWCSFIR